MTADRLVVTVLGAVALVGALRFFFGRASPGRP